MSGHSFLTTWRLIGESMYSKYIGKVVSASVSYLMMLRDDAKREII